jgi:hypothetical protein
MAKQLNTKIHKVNQRALQLNAIQVRTPTRLTPIHMHFLINAFSIILKTL